MSLAMSKSKDIFTPVFNNKDCINHLRLYQFDIEFTQKVGNSIITNFENSTISDKELVVQLRGYITSKVLNLCKLREIINFIEKSEKIKFNNDTEKFVNKFKGDSAHLTKFRNHYIAHPLKNNHKEKTEYLLSISDIKPYMSDFFQLNEQNIENKLLILKIKEQCKQLEHYNILIDHIINCIPNTD